MDIAVPKTESKPTWILLETREQSPFWGEFDVSAMPAKLPRAEKSLFSFAAEPKMTTGDAPEESDLEEYQWFDQEEAKIEDIQTQWEDGTAYESPEAAEAWMLEIQSLQEDIDSSPYLDEETKAAYDEQFDIIYNQPAKNHSNGNMLWVCGGHTLTLGDQAYGYTRWDNGEYVDPNASDLYVTLQDYHNYPEDQGNLDAISASLNTIQEMLIEEDPGPPIMVGAFDSLNAMYTDLLEEMSELDPENMAPSQLLALQYQMTQLSQLTEAMSNSIAGFNSIISSVLRNFR